MTFFYDLNKKLDSIREKPEVTHKQLNERDMSRAAKGYEKYGKQGMEALAKAGREGKALDPIRKKYNKYDEGATGAAIGGGLGSLALGPLGGAAGAAIGHYTEKGAEAEKQQTTKEGLGSVAKKLGGIAKKVGGKVLDKLGHGSDEDLIRDLQKKAGVPQTGKKPQPPVAEGSIEGYDTAEDYQAKAQWLRRTLHLSPDEAKEMAYDTDPETWVGSPWEDDYKQGMEEGSTAMTPKQKKFAKLAPPTDKITFADKIAGAKKEVDEMLGDVAAEAMKAALSPKQKKLDKNKNGKLDANDFAMLRKGAGKEETDEGSTGDYSAKKARAGKDIGKPGKAFAKIAKGAAERYGSKERGEKVAGAVLAKLRKKGGAEEMEEGWDDMLKDVEKRRGQMKTGEKVKGHKGEIEKTASGIRHTRSYDAKTGETDSDDQPTGEKRGRGRPKGPAKAPERVTAKATKHKGGRKMSKEEIEEAIAALEGHGYKVDKLNELSPETISSYQKKAMPQAADASNPKSDQRAAGVARTIGRKTSGGEKELDEKAVSKKQQRFMGMVHATQKGEKAPSKEVAKVAKTMKKSDAEDFAATKHKGLPEKVKSKKKEKTEEAGGTGTPTASSGFSFGKGIYDSMNHELENMIAESMSINVSSSTDGGKNITVTASEEDAVKLAQILKSAGLGGGEGYGGTGYKSACGCDAGADCGCGDQQVDENSPDWPTNQETAQDNFEYSGGLNGPKSTGQTTVPVIAGQEERQGTYAEAEEDAIKRMMEMAGIKEAKKVKEDDVEEGNKFTGNLAKARAAGKKEADLDGDGDMEKVRESVDQGILDATANLWSEYKGRYGV